MQGKITLSFLTENKDGSLTQHRNTKMEYASIDLAREWARVALKRYPHITYASIMLTPAWGSPREVERVGWEEKSE